MNNKCNNCAKFLTCNRNECKKISFVEAEILEKPKLIKTEKDGVASFGMSMREAEENIRKQYQKMKKILEYRRE